MSAVEKAFCTTSEAATLLGVSVGTVQMWVESGLLDAWKTTGGHRRVVRESILRLLHNAQAGAARLPAMVVNAPSPQRLSVVVVEDDPHLLRLYQTQISRWPGNPDCLAFDSAFSALLHIGRSKPDLLILDLQLPGIDGFGLLRVLREVPETADTRIVVVSGLDEAVRANRGGLPADIEVLPKPIPFARLLEIAEDLMQAKQFKRPSAH